LIVYPTLPTKHKPNSNRSRRLGSPLSAIILALVVIEQAVLGVKGLHPQQHFVGRLSKNIFC
jgi:hypothetical protein